jgi:hypothetical protein
MVLKRREGRVRRRDFMVSRAADVLAPVPQPRICLTILSASCCRYCAYACWRRRPRMWQASLPSSSFALAVD